MANTPGGSFIPKRSTGRVSPVRSGKRIYIFSYIAYVMFFGTLLSVLGIFFLNQQAASQLNQFVLQVDEAQQSFDKGKIESIRTLDNRIKTAEQVLNWHVAPSKIFTELESVIVKSIQLDNFSYTRPTGDVATVSFSGHTDTFDVLLFQRSVINSDSFLASADIVSVSYGAGSSELLDSRDSRSTVQRNAESTVTFTFEDASSMDSIKYTPEGAQETVVPDFTDEVIDMSSSTVETEGSDSLNDTDV